MTRETPLMAVEHEPHDDVLTPMQEAVLGSWFSLWCSALGVSVARVLIWLLRS